MLLRQLHQESKRLVSVCALIFFCQLSKSQPVLSLVGIETGNPEIVKVILEYTDVHDNDITMYGWFNPADSTFINCNTGIIIRRQQIPKYSKITYNSACPCKNSFDVFKIITVPSVSFTTNSVRIDQANAKRLDGIAEVIRNNPTCKVRLIGYGSNSKKAQQISWDRVNAVATHLIEKQGISPDRIIFIYGQDGDAGIVDLEATNEDGPQIVPAPHPNLRKSQ